MLEPKEVYPSGMYFDADAHLFLFAFKDPMPTEETVFYNSYCQQAAKDHAIKLASLKPATQQPQRCAKLSAWVAVDNTLVAARCRAKVGEQLPTLVAHVQRGGDKSKSPTVIDGCRVVVFEHDGVSDQVTSYCWSKTFTIKPSVPLNASGQISVEFWLGLLPPALSVGHPRDAPKSISLSDARSFRCPASPTFRIDCEVEV